MQYNQIHQVVNKFEVMKHETKRCAAHFKVMRWYSVVHGSAQCSLFLMCCVPPGTRRWDSRGEGAGASTKSRGGRRVEPAKNGVAAVSGSRFGLMPQGRCAAICAVSDVLCKCACVS